MVIGDFQKIQLHNDAQPLDFQPIHMEKNIHTLPDFFTWINVPPKI